MKENETTGEGTADKKELEYNIKLGENKYKKGFDKATSTYY